MFLGVEKCLNWKSSLRPYQIIQFVLCAHATYTFLCDVRPRLCISCEHEKHFYIKCVMYLMRFIYIYLHHTIKYSQFKCMRDSHFKNSIIIFALSYITFFSSRELRDFHSPFFAVKPGAISCFLYHIECMSVFTFIYMISRYRSLLCSFYHLSFSRLFPNMYTFIDFF